MVALPVRWEVHVVVPGFLYCSLITVKSIFYANTLFTHTTRRFLGARSKWPRIVLYENSRKIFLYNGMLKYFRKNAFYFTQKTAMTQNLANPTSFGRIGPCSAALILTPIYYIIMT